MPYRSETRPLRRPPVTRGFLAREMIHRQSPKKDMVKERDSKQLPGFPESPGNILILGAWLKLARGVIVPKDKCGCADQQCILEDHTSGNGGR